LTQKIDFDYKKETKMRRWLCHDKLSVRFATLFGLSLALFFLLWAFSYAFLPEGIMRGRSGAALLAGDTSAGSFLGEFLRIFAINLIVGAGLVVLANRVLLVNGYPLGYLPVLIQAGMYAIILGTNSFSIPLPARMGPSLTVFKRSGLYEIAAYALLATATSRIATSKARNLFTRRSEPVEPKPNFWRETNLSGVVISLLILAAANAWEAYMIVNLP
jgi:hypothetical protein